MSGKMTLNLFHFWCDVISRYLLMVFEIMTSFVKRLQCAKTLYTVTSVLL